MEVAKETGRKIQVERAAEQAATVKQGSRTDLTSLHGNEVTQGNRSDYLLRRLARDYPEYLERYEVGEFASVRQAAIAAGIVKQPTALERAIKAGPSCER